MNKNIMSNFSLSGRFVKAVIANQSADWCGNPVDFRKCAVESARKPSGIATPV